MNNTLDFYDHHAENFIEGTIGADMHFAQDQFLSRLPAGGRILDFGCGSGRDTRYFLEQGYQVTATDGSAELCRLASEYTGIPVRQMLFQDLDEVAVYDGIWACASILHLPKAELLPVLVKMCKALKSKGLIYTSFKYGTFEGERGGRYFTDFTDDEFRRFIQQVPELDVSQASELNISQVPEPDIRQIPESDIGQNPELNIIDCWITEDVRPGRQDEKWLNLLLQSAGSR